MIPHTPELQPHHQMHIQDNLFSEEVLLFSLLSMLYNKVKNKKKTVGYFFLIN